MTIKIACVFLVFFVGPILTAQNSANRGDTPAWIVTTMSEEAGMTRSLPSSGYLRELYRDVSVNDCKLRYTAILHNSFTELTVTDRVSVPLDKDTAVSGIHDYVEGAIDDYAVEISRASKTITIQRTKESGGHIESKEVLNTGVTHIIFGKPKPERGDIVSRTQKELTPAIQLCSEPTSKKRLSP